MPKNILLLMTDQQRSEYVGYIPDGEAVTPNINRIAENAYFTSCITPNPICTPARTSLITGRYSRQIGTLTMSGDFMPQIPTFMQALQKNGYTTYGIGKFHYCHFGGYATPRNCGYDHVALEEETKKYGYDYIWETAGKQTMVPNYDAYIHYMNEKGLADKVRDFMQECGGINGDTADHNFDKALPWPFEEEDFIDVVTARIAREKLQEHPKDTPFYMMVSFCSPHKPYGVPQRYLDMFPLEKEDNFILPDGQVITEDEKMALYKQRRASKAMIKLIDDQVGLILEDLEKRDLLKDTLIIFTTDHGDMLGDHYMIQKGVPWRQATNVPLAAWLPEAPKNIVNDHVVQLFDVAATILDYAGLDPQKALSRGFPAYNNIIPSRSFLPVLKGETDRIRDWAYAETDITEEQYGTTTQEEVIKKRGFGRTCAWRMIVTDTTKYIKYLNYKTPGMAYEEFYDLSKDPDETVNLIAEAAYQEQIQEARYRMDYVIDQYPPAQTNWITKFATDRKIN